MAGDDLDALVDAVRAGAKYRHLDVGLVEAVAAAEMAKGRNFKANVKAARNKLHQMAGAYFPDRPDYAEWLDLIDHVGDDEERRAALRQIMAQHASTRERLPLLEDFYATVLGDLSPVQSVLDLACGLNPLAQAWMPLGAEAVYYACDIYQDQIDFLNGAFARLGLAGEAFVANLLAETPRQAVDVALLLKTIPCLEQFDKAIGPQLLAEINAPVVVVSFPARSLGGRNKGMVQNYAEHFAQMVAGERWQVTRFDFASEMVFRIRK